MNKKKYISLAKSSVDTQLRELKKIKKIFNNSFIKAVDLILNCKGKIIFAGIGKSGLIARKISATFSSVGMPSFFCDPAQALHGDMGQIEKKDILIIFSYSGNTSELNKMLSYANRFNIKIIGVASKPDSTLIKASDVKLVLPKVKEADVTGMVPTSSTTITLLLGDCLATTAMKIKNFSKEKFKIFHPGGNIGKSLLLAKDIMTTGSKMPVVDIKKSLSQTLKIMTKKKLGIIVVTKKKFIEGIITDGDLRRELNKKSLNNNIEDIVTKNPLLVSENLPASKALSIMSEKKITSLLVVPEKNVNKKNKTLKGIIHIHTLLQNGIK